jgi:hypothetical protein
MLDGGISNNLTGNLTGVSGRTLLHKAAGPFGASIEHVKLLVEHGADLDAKDELGEKFDTNSAHSRRTSGGTKDVRISHPQALSEAQPCLEPE